MVNLHSDLLSFFKFLELEKCKYVWIHSYGEDDNPGDIDICIENSFFNKADELILAYCKKSGYVKVQMLRHETHAKCFILAKSKTDVVDYLVLDFCADYMRNGRVLMSSNEILENRKKEKDFFIPSQDVEATYIFLKCILKKRWTEKHSRKFFELYFQSKIKSEKLLLGFLDKNAFEKLISAINLNSQEVLESEIFNFRKNILQKTFFKNPLTTISYWLNEIPRTFSRIMYPTGLVIAILGPDGSGKSSLIDGLLNKNIPAFRKNKVFHLRPFYQKNMGVAVTNPHLKKQYGFILSYIKLFYFTLGYCGGYFVNIVSLKITSTLVIFDRYYDDLLADPKRYRYGGNMLVAKWVRFIVPKPDLYVVLNAKEEIIISRKQEVPVAELTRQLKIYFQLSSRKNNHPVDAGRTKAEVILSLENIILKKLAARY